MMDESSKWRHLDGYMTKWKPRKVCAHRDFPPRCGPRATEAGERGAIENVEVGSTVAVNVGDKSSCKGKDANFGCLINSSAAGVCVKDSLNVPVEKLVSFGDEVANFVGDTGEQAACKNVDLECGKSEIGNSVMPGGDGIPYTASMGVVTESSESKGTLNAKLKLRNVYAGRDFPPERGPSHVPINMKARERGAHINVDLVERNSGIRNSVMPGVDGIPNTASMGVGIESSETNGTGNARDGSGCLCSVGFDCGAHESDTSPACDFGKSTSSYGVEDHVMTTEPSCTPLQTKNVVDGSSHLLSSAHDSNNPVKLKINFCHRKASAVRELPPGRGINVSFRNSETEPEEDIFLDNDECLVDEPEVPLLNGLHAVFGNGVGRTHGRSSLHPHVKDKVTPRGTEFTAGKEMRKEILHGIMAAPYCPRRTGKVSADNTDSRGKMKLLKRKYVLADSNSSPKQPSGGPSKRRLVSDRLDTDRNPSSSAFLDTKYGGEFTERQANINPSTILSPDFDGSPGKSCNVNPSWRNKSKAAARKSICGGKFSGNKKKLDVPIDSPSIRKRKNFNVRLMPQFGPNSRGNARSRVRETLMLFHSTCRKLLQQEETHSLPEKEGTSKKSKKLVRIDLEAAKLIKEEGKEINAGKQILGAVPGVEVGDEFQYRVELAIVGIHRLYQAGIDSMKIDGVSVANSIVTSGSYDDDTEHADVLIYSGQGGNIVGKNKNYQDQKLEKGNLALSNSMEKGTPVRVVRGWRETLPGNGPLDSRPKLVTIYYYDGLYTVQRYWEEEGSHGKKVYKFELTRNPGQPELAWKELKKASKSKFRRGLCNADISGGLEKFPICAVNELDDDKPPRFTYISKMKYPHWHRPSPPVGCSCIGKCSGSGTCACGVRNGGKIPYTYNGSIVEDKLVVYECGPHCKCPPTCYNRVTQRGIKFRLEIFKTKRRGWGVRALTSIPSGGFVCEYVGELLEDTEAEKRVGNDEYLFDIGQNILDSSLNNEELAVSAEEEGGYTIDARNFGNVGRFINHSCSPNLYAQNVIHDHDDKKMPRIMLFARENIPAFQELTYHYNYKLDQVFHPDGNIKTKKCFCGSAECSGRLY